MYTYGNFAVVKKSKPACAFIFRKIVATCNVYKNIYQKRLTVN